MDRTCWTGFSFDILPAAANCLSAFCIFILLLEWAPEWMRSILHVFYRDILMEHNDSICWYSRSLSLLWLFKRHCITMFRRKVHLSQKVVERHSAGMWCVPLFCGCSRVFVSRCLREEFIWATLSGAKTLCWYLMSTTLLWLFKSYCISVYRWRVCLSQFEWWKDTLYNIICPTQLWLVVIPFQSTFAKKVVSHVRHPKSSSFE